VTKTSLTLTLLSLLAGCNGLSAGSQAVTVPSSPCDTTGAPVLQGVLSLRVNAPRSLVSGTTAPVTATATDNSGNHFDVTKEVTWSSSNFLAASTDGGTLYAIGTGAATIRATLGEVTATADVDILSITLESLTLVADSETATAGALTAWHVTGRYNDGSTADLTASASWTTSDANIAVVEEAGQVRAIGAGMAMVSATVSDQQASAPLMVTTATLTALRIDGASSAMSSSDLMQLTATGIYSDGSTANLTTLVTWSTSDGSVATVSLGRVQGISSGSVTISATTDGLLGSADLALN
jgi:trimeric autotransporter adhesin